MDGWMDGWMYVCMYVCMDGWMDVLTLWLLLKWFAIGLRFNWEETHFTHFSNHLVISY